jgi:hypothetical protein
VIELITITVLMLHTPGDHEIAVVAEKIIAMKGGEGGDKNKYVTGEARCVITTDDGKFLSVVETCEQVRRLIDEGKRP